MKNFYPADRKLSIIETVMMTIDDLPFLLTLAEQLDKSISKLIVEEESLTYKMNVDRMETLKTFWKQDLSAQEESEFKKTLDYSDKALIRTWARLKRARHTRAEIKRTLMLLNSEKYVSTKAFNSQ